MYLDIETTGLSPMKDDITIIGLLCNDEFQQFIGHVNLKAYYVDEFIMMHEPTEVVGYNSNRFDIPFMQEFGVETLDGLTFVDLMHQCHDLNLKGGLKAVEKILGIEREYEPLNFFQQTALWKKWINNNDWPALDRLLAYNKEDVLNLPLVEEKLAGRNKKKEKANSMFKKAYSKKLGTKE
jgi:uncharacterized protein YprB with RNaseH-like and TPR domain